MQNPTQLNVLVSPLDWGIGHATRCVPIINELLNRQCNIIIATNGRSGEFLKKEFPSLKQISINAYNIKYSRSGKNMVFMMALQIPRIVKAIVKEHFLVKKIVRENNIHLIISDNRYGLWHKNTYSVFITHQLMIKMPEGFSFAEKFVHKIIGHFICRFDECWIPDFKDSDSLSGDLSHKYKTLENTCYIGPLSRFSAIDFASFKVQKEIDVLFLLSGPEPQRTIFENLVLKQLSNSSTITKFQSGKTCLLKLAKVVGSKKSCLLQLPTATNLKNIFNMHSKYIVLRGVTDKEEEIKLNERVTIYSHLSTEKLAVLISNTKIVVSRSGYSTIMDLLTLGADAVLIPTPGQTEQEYLASYLSDKKFFYSIQQDKFNINDVKTFMNYSLSQNKRSYNNEILTKRMDAVIDNIMKK